MDINWERSYPFYQINEADLKALFPSLAESQLLTWQKVPIGCRNSNYVILSDKGKYLLRISSTDPALFQNEIHLNKYLTNLINCPKLLDVKINDDRYFLLYEYIEGENFSNYLLNNKISKGHISQVAETIAKIHSLDFTNNYNIKEIDLPPFITWYDYFLSNQKTAKILGEKRVAFIKRFLHEHHYLLKQITEYISFIHSDFRPSNMIITPLQEIFIVDWEYCTIGHSLADIGQFFRYRECFNDDDKKLFAQSYNSLALTKLPPNWYLLSRLRDLINPLQLLGSVEKKLQQQKDLLIVVDEILADINKKRKT